MSTEDIAKLRIRIEATTAKFESALARSERRLRQSSGKMERQARGLDRKLSDVGKNFGIAIPARAAVAGAAILAIGTALRATIREGEKVKLLEGRFKALTGSAERARDLIKGTFEIATRTGVAFQDVGQGVARFTLAAEAIGATDQEVLQLTDSVQKLGLIGGGSVQEITSGTIQLGQALASGRLQGDELRSILENTPLVAKAIADGLGVGVGQLREMGKEGKLLSKDVFAAILSQTEDINTTFAEIPVTSSRAMGMIRAELTKSLSLIDDLTGASATWANVLTTAANLIARINSGMQVARVNTAQRNLSEIQDELSGRAQGRYAQHNRPFGRGQPRRFAGMSDAELRAAEASASQTYVDAFRDAEDPLPYAQPPDRTSVTPTSGDGRGGSRKVTDAERAAGEYRNLAEAIRAQAEALEFELSIAEMSDDQQAKAIANRERDLKLRELQDAAARSGAETTDAERRAAEEMADQVRDLTIARDEQAAAIDATRRASEEAARSMDDFSQRMGNAIGQARSLNDVMNNLIATLAEEAFLGLFQNKGVFAGLGDAIGGAIGGSAGGSNLSGAGKKKFATGGRPNIGQLSMVGERGPEPFIADTPGRILSHADAMRAMRGGSSGNSINVIIQNNAGAEVSTQQGGPSGQDLIVMIDQATARNMGNRNSATSQALNARNQITRR